MFVGMPDANEDMLYERDRVIGRRPLLVERHQRWKAETAAGVAYQ